MSMSFDLSSTTSSDEGSVVDISALLPDKNETKGGSSHLLFESSSSSVEEEEDKTKNQTEASKSVSIINKTHRKKTGADTATNLLSESVDKQDGDPTICVVMGESVKNWKRLNKKNNRHHANDSSSSAAVMTNRKYIIVVEQGDASSDPSAKEIDSPHTIDFEKSRLDVQKSTNGKDLVHIVETSEGNVKRYTTQTCKDQWSKNGSQAPPSTSSAFVDCIALWDPERQVYTLELPELVASRTSSTSRFDRSDDDQNKLFEQRKHIENRVFQNRKRRRS